MGVPHSSVHNLCACPRGLPLSITLPLSDCLCVKQPVIHDIKIRSFDRGSADANRHGGSNIPEILLPK